MEIPASRSQYGFVAKRQLLQNAVDLDFFSRRETLECQQAVDDRNLSFLDPLDALFSSHRDLINILPVMLLFDYAMAFPSDPILLANLRTSK